MRINSSSKAAALFEKSVSKEIEEFWAAALDSQLTVIEKQLLFRGTVDQCLMHPRDLIRFLCLQNASAFIVCHNHPSGNTQPSKQDIKITQKIFRLSLWIEIGMKDHIILGQKKYYSFADQGRLIQWSEDTRLKNY